MKNPHRQVVLRSGTAKLECNLPDHPKLKVGNRLTLKDHDDSGRWWNVVWVSEYVRDKSSIKTAWTNNI